MAVGKFSILTRSEREFEQDEPCHYEQVGDKWVVYRTRDRKVLKSVDYFKPNLKQFFEEKQETTAEDFDNAPFGD